ncbi:hypothetical protein [Candidatus Entotheonella palauensis]|uniref:Uncharacterized protein n=1 Tax=Candidatus Entotheonella gemina TaxID=1429439 RepID=W4M7Q0_9BACT|nr:hypothetical protein [Candidatus Entotheonella palauensis]ETX06364.1 MAG: hypothetical protein ETSY2_17575 [Candidatus Entotheonella gemina]
MSFPIIPLLTMALLMCGIGAFLWELYHADKERQATSEAIMALLIRPNDTLGKASTPTPFSRV